MANEEHLKILRQGVEFWNKWWSEKYQEESAFPLVDLREADLRGIDLQNAYLWSADLSRANLFRANLSRAVLTNTNFTRTNLIHADFEEANLTEANFFEANLSRANFRRAILNGASFFKAKLFKANLNSSYLCKANFVSAKLDEANLSMAKLDEADLGRACLMKANLSQADLQFANLKDANLVEANLEQANLLEACVIGALFHSAILTGACLQDWHRNEETRLEKVTCSYVYLKVNCRQRLPLDRNFDLAEFSQLFQADRSYSHLAVLDQLINRFEKLLNDFPEGNESIFHDFLKDNPILFDVRVSRKDIVSKPRFYYPPEEPQNGKTYVEPDFVIKYAGNEYKLVELEKPEKRIATKQGQQTCDVTQAVFQTQEWEDYIRNYVYLIRDEYPGIANSRSYLVVIGRRNEKSIGIGRDPERYMGLINSHYPHEEICTYDDLLDKAKQAHAALISLSV